MAFECNGFGFTTTIVRFDDSVILFTVILENIYFTFSLEVIDYVNNTLQKLF
jgi:hypothetical protein